MLNGANESDSIAAYTCEIEVPLCVYVGVYVFEVDIAQGNKSQVSVSECVGGRTTIVGAKDNNEAT